MSKGTFLASFLELLQKELAIPQQKGEKNAKKWLINGFHDLPVILAGGKKIKEM